MPEYSWDLALVKYYRENINDYLTYLPLRVVNTLNQTLYVRETIVNQGNLGWTFDDGSQVRTFSVSARNYASRTEGIKAGTAPAETQKDQITVVVEYFTDEAMQNKFGQDVINATIHAYIQQQDGTWGSSQYSESDVVYDYWDFAGIAQQSISGSVNLDGVNNIARMYMKHTGSYYFTIYSDIGIVTDTSLRVDVYTHEPTSHMYIYFQNVSDNSPITDKFIAGVATLSGSKSHSFVLGYVGVIGEDHGARTYYSSGSGAVKFVFYPLGGLYPTIHAYASGWPGAHQYANLDGFIVFNKLP